MNQLVLESAIDLGPKLLHKSVQSVVLNRSLIAPDSVDDGVSSQYDMWIPHHEFEYQEFSTSESD